MSTVSNSAQDLPRHAYRDSPGQRKRMKQPKAAAAPPPASWRSVRLARSHSQTSAYSTEEELDSPNLIPRFSASSTLTTLTTPRSSIPSPELPSKAPSNNRIGQRVRVDHMGLTGTLRFLGTTQFKAGVWAGIELDTPGAGKNDGSVEGVKYFSCAPKSGIFVQSSKISFENSSSTTRITTSPSRFTPSSRSSRFPPSPDTPTPLSKQKLMPSLRVRYRQQQQQHRRQPTSTGTRSVTPAQSASLGIPSPEITPTKCDLTIPSNKQRDPRCIDGQHKAYTVMESRHDGKDDQTECLDCIQLQLDNTQLQADLAATKSKLAQANEALSSNTELVMSYQERIESLENSIQELKNAGMETIELYEKSMHQHGIDAKCSAEKMQKLEAEKDTLLSAKENLEQHIRTQDEKIQNMETTIHQLEQQLHQQHQDSKLDVETMKSNLEDLEKQLNLAKQALETEYNEHTATKEKITTMHKENQEKYDILAREFEQYRLSMESQQRDLADKLVEAEQRADALNSKATVLETKLQIQQREASQEEHQRIQLLETTNAQLQQELVKLQRQHAQLQCEHKCLRERSKELPPIPEGAAVSPSSPWQLQQMLASAQREIERMRKEHERQLSEQENTHRQQVNMLNRDIAELESLIEAKVFKEADLLEALDHERRVVKRLLSDHRSSVSSVSSLGSHRTYPSSRYHRRRETAIISISSAPSDDVPGIPEEEGDDDIPFCEVCQESGHDLMSCSTVLSQLPTVQQCNAIPTHKEDTLVSFSEHNHVF